MESYRVLITTTLYEEMLIEADSAEEAEDIARQQRPEGPNFQAADLETDYKAERYE